MSSGAGNKSVRFTRVVQRCGKPQVHTLWLPPEKDPELRRAQRAHRVMTVAPNTSGGKTDVGVVGFNLRAGKHGQFLIFPRSLKRFDGARVVGIKFDFVGQAKPAAAESLHAVSSFKHGLKSRRHEGSARPARTRKTAPTPDDSHAATSEIVPFERPDAAPAPDSGRSAKQSPASRHRSANTTSSSSVAVLTRTALVREIRAAMNDLRRGKTVPAYQRLERAVSAHRERLS